MIPWRSRIWILLFLLCPLAHLHVMGADMDMEGESESLPCPGVEAVGQATEYLQRHFSNRAQPGDAVRAAKAFALAATTFRNQGDENAAQGADACIFWCKHLLTDSDVDVYAQLRDETLAEAFLRVDPPSGTDAALALRNAGAFALQSPDEPWQVAARYFEIRHRYPGTPEADAAEEEYQIHLLVARLSNASETDAEELLRERLPTYAEARDTFLSEWSGILDTYLEVLDRTREDVIRRNETELDGQIQKDMNELRRRRGLSMEDYSQAGRSAAVGRITSAQRTYHNTLQRLVQNQIRTLEAEARNLDGTRLVALVPLLEERIQAQQNILTALQNLVGRARIARDLVGTWDISIRGARSNYAFTWTFEHDGTFTMTESYRFSRAAQSRTRTLSGEWTFDGEKIRLTRHRSRHNGSIQLPLRGRRLRGTWIGADYSSSFYQTGSSPTARTAQHESAFEGTPQIRR